MSRLFTSVGANYIGVRDTAAAVSWYKEKLGVREINIEMDDSEDCIALGFSDDEYIVALGPQGKPSGELRPLLFAKKLSKVHEFLNAKGVSVTGIEQDAEGTHFFEMRDLEGNVIEISEEP